ncbi:hypothetical protein BH10CHL1_BH10CHL1_06830 [soil metagenome]
MSDTVIKVENLSKSYTIRHQTGERYTALRDVLSNGVKDMGNRLLGRPNGHIDASSEEFWALNDVSFEVKQGESIGIIGRNGAGKSTLLKILSRITEPTSGRVRIKGRVASLLEVGTGFHPELTGRENIYLNGAILGMGSAEIRRKFDEIVAFAGIDKFLDTPVKRYSSGMYVRLAFAVAAHLEPEILVVDEVLAVGDAAFQKKCLGKMSDIAEKEGRTVLFVSHNMDAIQALCSKSLTLHSGQIIDIGIPYDQIQRYLNSFQSLNKFNTNEPVQLGEDLWLDKFCACPHVVTNGSNLLLEIAFSSQNLTSFSQLAILIYSSLGTRVAILDMRSQHQPLTFDHSGKCYITITIRSLPLIEGDYDLGLYLDSLRVTGDFLNLSDFTVIGSPSSNGIAPYAKQFRGFIDLNFDFKINE